MISEVVGNAEKIWAYRSFAKEARKPKLRFWGNNIVSNDKTA